VLAEDGSIYAGANVENASYGLTVCAERVAIYGAVAAGCRRLRAVAVAGQAGISPCGACRQVMQEFGVEIVILVSPNGRQSVVALHDLLPLPFARLAGTRKKSASRRGQAVLEPERPARRNASAAFSTFASRVSRRPAHARL
jgi:cytidine deaminase